MTWWLLALCLWAASPAAAQPQPPIRQRQDRRAALPATPAQPAKAGIAVVSNADGMDGKEEVDRQANTPEALLAALKQKEAELEELKARCAESGPVGLVLSGWFTEASGPISLVVGTNAGDGHGLDVRSVFAFKGKTSALVAVRLRNLPDQKPWTLEQARITGAAGAPVKVLSVQMKQPQLEPGEEGLVVVETKTPPWAASKVFIVEFVAGGGQRRLSINLVTK